MIRKSFAIDEALNVRLKQRAKELGVTESEIVRRSLSETLRATSVERGWTRDELYDRPRAYFQTP